MVHNSWVSIQKWIAGSFAVEKNVVLVSTHQISPSTRLCTVIESQHNWIGPKHSSTLGLRYGSVWCEQCMPQRLLKGLNAHISHLDVSLGDRGCQNADKWTDFSFNLVDRWCVCILPPVVHNNIYLHKIITKNEYASTWLCIVLIHLTIFDVFLFFFKLNLHFIKIKEPRPCQTKTYNVNSTVNTS